MKRTGKTLPDISAVAAAPKRGALEAGLAFIDGVAAGWGRQELIDWFAEQLVATGRMQKPGVVREAVVGAIVLDPATSAKGAKVAPIGELPKLLATARSRVVVSLRAFIAAQPDDRFLKGAIYGERVQRVRHEGESVWVARPRETDLLSDIVLSLFAVDILMHREFHERNLCVCEVCGRVSFNPDATTRLGCAEHLPKSEQGSGFREGIKTT